MTRQRERQTAHRGNDRHPKWAADCSAIFSNSSCCLSTWRSMQPRTSSRSFAAGIASSSTEVPTNFLALVSVILVGRLGRFQSLTCARVTAGRSK